MSDTQMNSMRSVYIMLSQTHTRFAGLIRKFGRTKYNHASISLDAELTEIYGFARPQHNAVLLARLVSENDETRFTLGKYNSVQVVIYKINVTEEQYRWIKNTIYNIVNDGAYIYNLLSVLSYPVFKGFRMYKAFSCIEFVMYLLNGIGYEMDKPICKYKPDDLLELLSDKKIYEGNLFDYKSYKKNNEEYFAPFTYKMFLESAITIKELFMRLILR